MTREEATNVLKDAMQKIETSFWTAGEEGMQALETAIAALSNESCEDAISFPKGTLKKRGKGYVVYNPEWLKENWRTELRVMGIECEDAISRQSVIDTTVCEGISCDECSFNTLENGESGCLLSERVTRLPSVNPKPKMGHCKDCKYFEHDSVASVGGVPLIVVHEICSKWGRGCKTNEDGYCFLFEPQESEGT